ncbi:MAG: hypothetical protein KAW89_08025 [Armatimonadetes bacterium]|nr:hypothetical protein [Armatimonadota bacterium]
MTVADEGEVYWGLYELIKKYGESAHPWAQVLAIELFALEPANLPFQECWDIVKSIYYSTEQFDETVGVQAALCGVIATIFPQMTDEQVDEARDILRTFESRLSADIGGEEMRDYSLGARDRVLELMETTERYGWGPFIPDEQGARGLVNVDELIANERAEGAPAGMTLAMSEAAQETTSLSEEQRAPTIPMGGTNTQQADDVLNRRLRKIEGDLGRLAVTVGSMDGRLADWGNMRRESNEAHKRDFDNCRRNANTALTIAILAVGGLLAIVGWLLWKV